MSNHPPSMDYENTAMHSFTSWIYGCFGKSFLYGFTFPLDEWKAGRQVSSCQRFKFLVGEVNSCVNTSFLRVGMYADFEHSCELFFVTRVEFPMEYHSHRAVEVGLSRQSSTFFGKVFWAYSSQHLCNGNNPEDIFCFNAPANCYPGRKIVISFLLKTPPFENYYQRPMYSSSEPVVFDTDGFLCLQWRHMESFCL